MRNLSLKILTWSLITAAVLIAGKAWPRYEIALWGAFLTGVAVVLYRDLKEPVNYKRIRITPDNIDYEASVYHHIIPFREILGVEYVREEAIFDGRYLETKWMVRTAGGKYEIMDEWPDRRKMLRAFKEYLPGFDSGAARVALKAKGEGRWVCFGCS